MAALETLSIQQADIGGSGSNLLFDVLDHCPNLKCLDLQHNKLGRRAVGILLGYGQMGALPHLKRLGILRQHPNPRVEEDYDDNMIHEDLDEYLDGKHYRHNGEHPYLARLDVQETLRRVWPALEIF